MTKIAFVNLDRQYETLKGEIDEAIRAVIDSKAFIQGPFVQAFEESFAEFTDCKHVMGCSNGTAAISLALEAIGVGRGDEVVTVAHTFAATANAIRHVGARPVFVDIESESYNMDPLALERALTKRTKAILPVHLYGTPCDLDGIGAAISGRNIDIIEDAAQAHGAMDRGKPIASRGRAATFSFYPGKNLGAYGDAGAVATNDDEVAYRVRRLRDHGRASKYLHDIGGYNQRMDGIQGAILSVKLRHLATWNERRRALAQKYDAALTANKFKTIRPRRASVPVYHLYIVEVANRDEVQKKMADDGIATGVHYPVPLHRQESFRHEAGNLILPVTERIAERIVSLPICGELSDEEQNRVIESFLRVARP